MFRISNMPIGIKLAAMSALGILLVGGMIVISLLKNGEIKTAILEANRQQTIERLAIETTSELRGAMIALRDVRLATDIDDAQKAWSRWNSYYDKTLELSDRMLSMMRLPENRARVEKMKALSGQYIVGAKEIYRIVEQRQKLNAAGSNYLSAVRELQDQEARVIRERTLPILGQLDNLSSEIMSSMAVLTKGEIAASEQAMSEAERVGLIVGILTMAILIGTVAFGAISIARPLKALTGPINELAAGNFNVAVNGVGRGDEIGQIATAMNAMVMRIRATIAEVKSSAREVTNASVEISTSTTDLSQRTEEQAASLEETSAAMEQLAATVKKNAENAQRASDTAHGTRDAADRGGQVVAEAVNAMARIEDSSGKIADIIGVIDEIARQTNLLALNAAVEAARAGDAGRGFAVVASEVRSLAQRSSQAAKDIKDLIISSSSQVKDGVKLVNQAGSALQEIVDSIRQVAEVASEIASASSEQATGLDQITKALAQMDEVTQQNSALVEENAATARTLEDQAKSMDEQVAFFQVDASLQPASAPESGVVEAAALKIAPKLAARQPVMKPAPAAAPASASAAAIRIAAPRTPAARPPAALRHTGGPVGRMQSALAVAIQDKADWKEF